MVIRAKPTGSHNHPDQEAEGGETELQQERPAFPGLIGGAVGLLLGWVMGLALNQAIQFYFKHEELPLRGPFFVVTVWLAAGAILFATLIWSGGLFCILHSALFTFGWGWREMRLRRLRR